jgi:predicted lipoprotein with Yx(FWY)xxD motif
MRDMKYTLSALALSATILLAACGGGGSSSPATPVATTPATAPTTAPTTAPSAAPTSAAPTAVAGSNGIVDLATITSTVSSSGATTGGPFTFNGAFVAAASGLPLYIYQGDNGHAGTAECTGSCLTIWPPVVATGTVTTPFGTVQNGSVTQLTYNTRPLYTFYTDTKGNATGNFSMLGATTLFYVASASVTATTVFPTYP